MKRTLCLWVLLFVCALPVAAQETPVTADEVNAIAAEMYCPVCENIPLDTCGTAACDDWRNEIRLMLEDGQTSDAIKADFVRRFGDRVLGAPLDPTLRTLSLVTPWLLAGLALLAVAWIVLRWRLNVGRQPVPAAPAVPAQDTLRARLERDIAGG